MASGTFENLYGTRKLLCGCSVLLTKCPHNLIGQTKEPYLLKALGWGGVVQGLLLEQVLLQDLPGSCLTLARGAF